MSETFENNQLNTCEFGEDNIDINKLIALAEKLPDESVEVSFFIERLGEDNYWSDSNFDRIKLRDIITMISEGKSFDDILQENPKWGEHIDKIKNADYGSYPIILIGNIIIDGMHRLIKACRCNMIIS